MKIFGTVGLEELARDVLLLISELASTTNDAIQELDEKIIFKKKGEA